MPGVGVGVTVRVTVGANSAFAIEVLSRDQTEHIVDLRSGSGVVIVVWWRYSGVTVVLQWYYSGDTSLLSQAFVAKRASACHSIKTPHNPEGDAHARNAGKDTASPGRGCVFRMSSGSCLDRLFHCLVDVWNVLPDGREEVFYPFGSLRRGRIRRRKADLSSFGRV